MSEPTKFTAAGDATPGPPAPLPTAALATPAGQTIASPSPKHVAPEEAPPAQAPPATAREAYGARAARGGMVIAATHLVTSAIVFVSQVVMAWLLLPDDFGTVAVAVSVAAVVGVMRDAGAHWILVGRQEEFDRLAGTVFALTMSAALICALITGVAAPILAHVKQNPVLLPVMLLTALRFPIGVMGQVSTTRLTIDLRWRATAIGAFLQPAVTAVAGILMAWRGYGVYSLIVPPILGDAARGLASWVQAGARPLSRPDLGVMRAIIGSSVYIVLVNLAITTRASADYLTLSFTRGEHETGLYYYAFNMSQGFGRLFLGVLPFVVAPVIAKVRHDPQRHAQAVTRSMHALAALATLPMVLQIVLAWPLFRLILQAKWAPGAPLFAILSLAILCLFLNNVVWSALVASGYYKEYFLYLLAFTPVVLVLFLGGALLAGATGVAWAVVIVNILDMILLPLYAFRLLKVPWAPVMSPLWRPLVAAAPAALLALALHHQWPATRAADVSRMILIPAAGGVAYLGLLLLLWRETLLDVWGRFAAAIGGAPKQPSAT